MMQARIQKADKLLMRKGCFEKSLKFLAILKELNPLLVPAQ